MTHVQMTGVRVAYTYRIILLQIYNITFSELANRVKTMRDLQQFKKNLVSTFLNSRNVNMMGSNQWWRSRYGSCWIWAFLV
jgi:hypothetical protein